MPGDLRPPIPGRGRKGAAPPENATPHRFLQRAPTATRSTWRESPADCAESRKPARHHEWMAKDLLAVEQGAQTLASPSKMIDPNGGVHQNHCESLDELPERRRRT